MKMLCGCRVKGPVTTLDGVAVCEACKLPRQHPVTLREAGQKFHDHAAACAHCTARPFDLCELGAQLLSATAAADAPTAAPEPEDDEVIVVGPEDRKLFVRALKSVLASSRAVNVVDGAILRTLIETLEGRRGSR